MDYNSQEKQILLNCFSKYLMLDKWIALIIENYIYSTKKESHGPIQSCYKTKYNYKHGECKRFYEYNNQTFLFVHCFYYFDKLHGSFKMYHHMSTQLSKEINYKHGKMDGTLKTYYPNGQRSIEIQYNNGKMNGTYKEYFKETGLLHIETCYLYGIKNGIYKEWYLNSRLAIETYYVNGKINGSYKEWSEDSVLIFDSIIIDEK